MKSPVKALPKKPAQKPATIQDVARAAGVSIATVSRTLSKPGAVAEETRKTVHEAIQRTGYRLNLAARNLRSQRTGTVLALVPNISNPFFSQILSGIAQVLAGQGMGLLLADTRATAGPPIEAFLSRSRCDGVILLDGAPGIAIEGPLAEEGRVLCACEWIEGSDLPRVRADNLRGGALAGAHLYQLGHRRIGFVGTGSNVLIAARRAGLERALAERGLSLDPAHVYGGDFSLEAGALAAGAWRRTAERPTALFCANDEMAVGLMLELQRQGLSVPNDLSVAGFDDIGLARHMAPQLTTVHQPRDELGRIAAETLLEMIAGQPPARRDRVLPVTLEMRGSTAAP